MRYKISILIGIFISVLPAVFVVLDAVARSRQGVTWGFLVEGAVLPLYLLSLASLPALLWGVEWKKKLVAIALFAAFPLVLLLSYEIVPVRAESVETSQPPSLNPR